LDSRFPNNWIAKTDAAYAKMAKRRTTMFFRTWGWEPVQICPTAEVAEEAIAAHLRKWTCSTSGFGGRRSSLTRTAADWEYGSESRYAGCAS